METKDVMVIGGIVIAALIAIFAVLFHPFALYDYQLNLIEWIILFVVGYFAFSYLSQNQDRKNRAVILLFVLAVISCIGNNATDAGKIGASLISPIFLSVVYYFITKTSPKTYITRSAILEKQGNVDEAIEQLEEGHKLFPDNQEIKTALGKLTN